MRFILSGACRHLIYINTRRVSARKMLYMSKVSLRGSSVMRLVAILVVLLFAPLTASATGSGTQAPDHAEHGVVSDHCADHCLGMGKHSGYPSEAPLHCHLQPTHPQAIGLATTAVDGDLPLLASGDISAPAPQAGARLPVAATHVPIVGLPRFISFGNFRS